MKHALVDVPKMHYLFIEKIGPFQETAMKAWQELRALEATEGKIGAAALYRFKPDMIYRAGWIVSQKPEQIPAGLKYEEIDGGKYEKFTHVGSYSALPQVSGQVWETAEKEKFARRDAWAIEKYVSDPATTPEDKLITEVMVAVK